MTGAPVHLVEEGPAAAVLITIPAAIVFLFAQRHLVACPTAGATKGQAD